MIELFNVMMSPSVEHEVPHTLYSGYIGEGEKVKEFEWELACAFRWENVLTVNSCTSALQLALHLIKDLDDRSEVLLPPLSCFATVSSVLQAGLKPRWVDIDPQTLVMDLSDLERKLNAQTKAVMPVHFAGMPIDLIRLEFMMDKHEATYGYRPYVIEDCAQSLGSQYGGHWVGSRCPLNNHICCFSFQAVKFLTSGDGGAIVLPNRELYERAKLLRWYGLSRDAPIGIQDVHESGFKYHMNNISATIGLENLKFIKENLAFKKQWERYLRCVLEFEELNEVQPCYPFLGNETGYRGVPSPCTNQLPLMVENMDQFKQRMARAGIETRPAHHRCDRHQCVSQYRSELPGMDEVEKKMTLIPIGWWLSGKLFDGVIKAVKDEIELDWTKVGF